MLEYVFVVLLIVLIVLHFRQQPSTIIIEDMHAQPLHEKLDRHIYDAVNTNGVIYRQQQRELRRLSDINQYRKHMVATRLMDEFIEKQKYIDENIDDIRRETLNEYMRKISPYVNSSIKHSEVVLKNCEDAHILATLLNASDELSIIDKVSNRCKQLHK